MPSRARGFGDGDAAVLGDGVFLDDDGVSALGDHAAGKDPHRLAGADCSVERAAGRDLADHLEPRRDVVGIGRAYRIAIHRRHRLRRLGPQRCDVARQHPVMRGIQPDHFLRQRLGAGQNGSKGIGNGHQRHGETP